MNIIIPIGGLGNRFKNQNYCTPKPLINVLGQPLIIWVLQNLQLDKDDKIFIIYNSILENFNFEDIIKHNFKFDNVFFNKINFITRGSAETVLCGLSNFNLDLDKLTLCIDCDTFYEENIIGISKEKNENLIFYFHDEQQHQIYSYIDLDGDKVVKIKEKIKISNNANTGAYCFKTARILKKYCEILINIKLIEKEYYISNLYDLMIQDKHVVFGKKIFDFHCLGTPEQLRTFCFGKTENKKRFCFDLDNTLVTYPKISGDYSSVEPIKTNIEYLRFLKEQGHTIIIYTARRMKTHNGNVGAVVADIANITFDSLNKFNIPYDEIYFGKPYADFYIDDLSVNPYYDIEKQCGFYTAKINSRIFNNIYIKDSSVVKTSDNLDGEIYWYKNIPCEVSSFFPKVINVEKNTLEIERIKGISVSHLYVNGALTRDILLKILKSISLLHNIKSNYFVDIYGNYANKIKDRFERYDYSRFQNYSVVYKTILDYLKDYELKNMGCVGVIHGDPVFTNIIIDINNNVKLIDMRGKIGDVCTLYGDIFYDYAKIYQSIIGYDFILHGVDMNENYCNLIKNVFVSYISNKYGEKAMFFIRNITNSLLFSLIPLHDNEKCLQYYSLINL